MLAAHTVRGIPPDHYRVPYRHIGQLLRTQAARFDERTWLTYYADESESPDRLTFAMR